MIGLWWLCHVQDVLAAASEMQLKAVRHFADEELKHRAGMKKSSIKCRQKRAVERVHKQLTLGRTESDPKPERASTEDVT